MIIYVLLVLGISSVSPFVVVEKVQNWIWGTRSESLCVYIDGIYCYVRCERIIIFGYSKIAACASISLLPIRNVTLSLSQPL